MSSRAVATPAAPTPLMTTLSSAFLWPVNLRELIMPAKVTVAAPHWSSCMTGIVNSARKRSSISKHLGAEMSSRLIAPKTGAICLTALIISSVSWVSRQIGKASTSANSLRIAALPSMTGMAASAPRLPRPKMAEPSETIATVLAFKV